MGENTQLQSIPGIRPTLAYTIVKEWALPVTLLAVGLGIGYYWGKVK